MTPSEHPDETFAATDVEMRKRAAAVLEVLGGIHTPSEAAQLLEISLQNYYLLEARALQGLVASCRPRSRGRQSGYSRTLHDLEVENDRLRRDLTRTQALARAVQRAAGVDPAPVETEGSPRRRRPKARALRAARRLIPKPETPPPGPIPAVQPPP